MKNSILLFVFLFTINFSFAVNNNYDKQMKKNIEALNKAEAIEELQAIANQFERIANKETDKWLPLYYTAFANIKIALRQENKDNIDPILDKAQKYIDKAVLLSKDNSEIVTMQGFLYLIRIQVSPMRRGREFSALANQNFDLAMELNPKNPRPYYLKGISVYNTPKMFGGGEKNALPLLHAAQEKFNNFKPTTEIMPNWGKEHNQEIIDNANKQ